MLRKKLRKRNKRFSHLKACLYFRMVSFYGVSNDYQVRVKKLNVFFIWFKNWNSLFF